MYILPIADEMGAYSNPQSTKAKGLVYLPDEFLDTYIACNGFVNLVIENDIVTDISENTEARDAWLASLPEETTDTPTTDAGSDDVVTWAELDAAYNEGRDSAYDQ